MRKDGRRVSDAAADSKDSAILMSVFDFKILTPIAVIVVCGIAGAIHLRREWIKIVGR